MRSTVSRTCAKISDRAGVAPKSAIRQVMPQSSSSAPNHRWKSAAIVTTSMRSNRKSKTGAIQLRKSAVPKIKRHRDRTVNRQSSDAILAELRHRLLEIYDLNAAGSVLYWDQATYMPNGGAL